MSNEITLLVTRGLDVQSINNGFDWQEEFPSAGRGRRSSRTTRVRPKNGGGPPLPDPPIGLPQGPYQGLDTELRECLLPTWGCRARPTPPSCKLLVQHLDLRFGGCGAVCGLAQALTQCRGILLQPHCEHAAIVCCLLQLLSIVFVQFGDLRLEAIHV